VHILIVLAVAIPLALLDGVYLSSALTKVPTGAWFTLLLAALLSFIFVLWRFGKENQWAAEATDRFQPAHLLTTSANGDLHLTQQFGGQKITSVEGVGIFFDKIGNMVPIVFTQFVRKFCASPGIIVFFHMRPLSTPTIPESERYVVQRTTIPGCYRMTVRHGYTDDIVTPDLGRMVVEQLILFITRDRSSSPSSASSADHSPVIQAELGAVKKAEESQVVYIMGKEQMKIKKGTGLLRRVLLESFLWIRENSRAKMADVDVSYEKLVEVGFIKEI
jgi:KUP system potassium uptake protein